MKASQFKTLIKEAVREAIQEELGSMQQPSNVQEAKATPAPAPVLHKKTGNAMQDILNETRANMTSDEYRTVMNANSSMVGSGAIPQAGPQPGLDLSQLDFAKKAGAIYQKSNELDKNKYGL